MEFANDFVNSDGILKVRCISQKGIVRRSDAFLITLDGNVVLLDAGLPEVPYALASLLELRALFLKGNEKLLENKDVKLKITWIASHLHIDHIGAFMDGISASPYIYVEKAYLPPRTEYFDSDLSPNWDGDYKYTEKLYGCFAKYQPRCTLERIPFSNKETFSFKKGEAVFTIFPPTRDWGTPDKAALCKELYAKENISSQPVSITNANSMWILLTYKGRKFLFTGDSMKKTLRDDENVDEMVANWKGAIGDVDVVKYPHHGMLRDEAAPLMLSFNPKYVICNAIDATGHLRMLEALENKDKLIPVLYGYMDKVFTVNPDGNLSLE